mgnify:FL=1
MKTYDIVLEFTEDMLASSPADPEVYARFIASRAVESKAEETPNTADEVEGLPPVDERGSWSVFHRNGDGIYVFDYKVRGFLKEAAAAVTGRTGLTAYKSKIDRWLFVLPRRIYMTNGVGQIIAEPQGALERPIRAMTMQGPRVSVKRSDLVREGARMSFRLVVLPLGERELTRERIGSWFDYGQWTGMGEWRTGSYGRFKVVSFEDA